MKAQSEILVFVLLSLLSIGMFAVTVVWGKDIFQKNIDMAKVSSVEKTIKDIDYSIGSMIKFGGEEEINYDVDGTIRLVNDNTVEIRTVIASDISLPKEWINISSDTSYIREILEGDLFRVQLVYPETDYKIEFFTDGPTLSKPKTVKIEKNSTYIENDKATIKIRITFV